jgi:hypothetical protein
LSSCPSLSTLPNLTELNVSNNHLINLPDVLNCNQLTILNIENNNIKTFLPDISLLPCLNTFLLSGNPQKIVSSAYIAKGSIAVLEYLRNKLPTNIREQFVSNNRVGNNISTVNSSSNPRSHISSKEEDTREETKQNNSISTQPSSIRSNVQPTRATAPSSTPSHSKLPSQTQIQTSTSTSAPTSVPIQSSSSYSQPTQPIQSIQSPLVDISLLKSEISSMESQLENNFSLTTLQKTNLRKSLQLKRAELTRAGTK